MGLYLPSNFSGSNSGVKRIVSVIIRRARRSLNHKAQVYQLGDAYQSGNSTARMYFDRRPHGRQGPSRHDFASANAASCAYADPRSSGS